MARVLVHKSYLNLGLATECPSGRVSLGISMKGLDCSGGIVLQRKYKLCCNFNKVVSLKCLVEKNLVKVDCFLYTKQCGWSFNSFRHFYYQCF